MVKQPYNNAIKSASQSVWTWNFFSKSICVRFQRRIGNYSGCKNYNNQRVFYRSLIPIMVQRSMYLPSVVFLPLFFILRSYNHSSDSDSTRSQLYPYLFLVITRLNFRPLFAVPTFTNARFSCSLFNCAIKQLCGNTAVPGLHTITCTFFVVIYTFPRVLRNKGVIVITFKCSVPGIVLTEWNVSFFSRCPKGNNQFRARSSG